LFRHDEPDITQQGWANSSVRGFSGVYLTVAVVETIFIALELVSKKLKLLCIHPPDLLCPWLQPKLPWQNLTGEILDNFISNKAVQPYGFDDLMILKMRCVQELSDGGQLGAGGILVTNQTPS
jgi:hypothetical protein